MSASRAHARGCRPERSPWVTWDYDWHLNVKPMLREVAESQGAGWMPGKLLYFDKPIARRYHARISGRRSGASRRKLSLALSRAGGQ